MLDLKKLVIASGNKGKLREIGTLLATLEIEVIPQSEFNLSEIDEPYATFVENALSKARYVSDRTGLPALADDSGICVNALKGAPGVFSARYAGEPKSDQRNNLKLVEALKTSVDCSAYYYCVIVLLRHAEDPQPMIVDGIWHGEIIPEPRGSGGFGYDPYFLLPGLGKTAAELDMDTKNTISHRGKALAKLIEVLRA
ncbi:MAG: RdgB/HAM1 family non-canonical purine NTP pyrophosphatase [Nitrosomonas sp.]|nr:RdgB/HAM1 family non-canonical purine NTP pyrophosphatase [Nitrosomonas sp.]MCW5617853.1 RdgB/HAM1 family non-canonical purine NTP pyrophosphatase [Nitrosomonas sp.]